MVIMIPLFIIFLSFAYLQLSDNITIIDQSIVAIIVIITILFSLNLYKKVKQNMKQQEINAILLEIKELEKKVSLEKDKEKKKYLTKKISTLHNEIDNF